jgi:hypothetical protein
MSTPDTTGPNDSVRDAPLSHLPDPVRRAIEITPAAGTRAQPTDAHQLPPPVVIAGPRQMTVSLGLGCSRGLERLFTR